MYMFVYTEMCIRMCMYNDIWAYICIYIYVYNYIYIGNSGVDNDKDVPAPLPIFLVALHADNPSLSSFKIPKIFKIRANIESVDFLHKGKL
jgi:hypothetical protein